MAVGVGVAVAVGVGVADGAGEFVGEGVTVCSCSDVGAGLCSGVLSAVLVEVGVGEAVIGGHE